MVKNVKKEKLILLDTHAILHRAFHALPDFSSSKGEPTGALYGLVSMLIKIIQDINPDYVIACFDLPGPTYRHEVYKEYKSKRPKADDALVSQIKRSRDVMNALSIPCYDSPGFEADDILGTIVGKLKDRDDLEIIIASGDMDTLQLVSGKAVKVFTLKKGIRDTVLYDEDAVYARFGFSPSSLPDFKGLRGDPSDNIIGISGIGEKTATTIIKEFHTIENLYQVLKKDPQKVKKSGITDRIIKLLNEGEEEARFSKVLAQIRYDAPIQFELPEKSWRTSVDIDQAQALFQDLEFRTLGPRLRTLLGVKENEVVSSEDVEVTIDHDEDDPEELERVGLALWILDSTITNPTKEDIVTFSKEKTLHRAKTVIFNELKKQNLFGVYDRIEEPLIEVTHAMEARGITLDVSKLQVLSKKYHHKLSVLQKKIWELAGKEFNINSPKQIGEVLFDTLGLSAKGYKKTQGGARSTRESVLQELVDAHPVVPVILEYRELQKLLSTYIDPLPKLVKEDHRLHTDFVQTGTTTGRMASKDPNLQNIPNRSEIGKEIRDTFVSAPGFSLVSFDYSQIELRIAAFLSGDEKLIHIFKHGDDVHRAVASEVFHVSPEAVTHDMRRRAKVINFGILYGMGVNALKGNLGTSRAEAQEFLNNYFETFVTLSRYLEGIKGDVRRRGYTETLFGRRRYFEGIDSKIPYVRAAAERMAINAPIQGTEADIIKLAMIRVDSFLKEKGCRDDAHLLLQVHDELVYEIKTSKVDPLIPDIVSIMEHVVPETETKGVPILVDVATGSAWGKLQKQT